MASSYAKVLMYLPVLASLSHSFLESHKHLFLRAEAKDQTANIFTRSWDMALLIMLWAALADLCNKAPGLFETSALSHNVWSTLLCKENCPKNQHLAHLLLAAVEKWTFAVKQCSMCQSLAAGSETIDRGERTVEGGKTLTDHTYRPEVRTGLLFLAVDHPFLHPPAT